ncbi:MAG: GAF domain-containing protein [Bacteroidales bacterium]|nr:GAF domain-containing protein [Bacteroidales bacterium]
MKFRFTVGKKLIFGFGIITIAVILSSTLTFITLQKNKKLNEEIANIYTPSVSYLNDLYFLITNSKMLIKNWVFIERINDTPDKIKLSKLHSEDFPYIEDKLLKIKNNWSIEEQETLNNILVSISDTLFESHNNIMSQLNSFDAYEDVMIIFEVNPMVEEGGEVIVQTDSILKNLEILSSKLEKKTEDRNTEMSNSLGNFQSTIIIIGIILTFIAFIIAILTIRSIVTPINGLKNFLLIMTKGILPKEKMKVSTDEIGDMSQALNSYIDGMRKTSEFSLEIGKGNFDADFTPLSKEDILGNSLINMRNNLQKAENEENKRKEEDELRNWVAQGLAKFADILRQNNDNMQILAYNVMSNLINYLDVNQGAIYILNDIDNQDIHYEMKSAIAYNRKKFLQKKIKVGEGLVGRCAYEKLTIYLTDIPEDYINITSGLGTANPKSLLLVPLKLNDGVFGVIEIATFDEFKPYQIDFVEKLGENIASTISSVKINEQTAILLQESQQKGEELAAQEEEMRQNMEELQATQEESARKEIQMRDTIDAINNTVGNVELDMDGTILTTNNLFAEIIKINASDIIGKKFISLSIDENEDYQAMWNNLRNGIAFEQTSKYSTIHGDVWLKESFNPFKNTEGDYDKVLVLIIDITEKINLEEKLKTLKSNSSA